MPEEVQPESGLASDEAQEKPLDNISALNPERTSPPPEVDQSTEARDATEEEINSLPHVADKVPWAAWIVILAGSAERFTYFGIITPWREYYIVTVALTVLNGYAENYIQNPRNHAVAGALGLGQSTATNISSAFFLLSYIAPMPFAVLADLKLGRYKTLMLGLILYMCGSIIMLTTSLPNALENNAGLGGLIASMAFIAMGAGVMKAVFVPFLGDQYLQKKPQVIQRKNGDLAIVDGTLTLQLMYNLYYWFTNVASLSSIPVTFLEKEYDFWAAFALTAASMCVSIFLFAIRSTKLNKALPQGNILPKAVKTLTCAAKSGFKLENAKPDYQKRKHDKYVPWTNEFVDEMKRGVLACRVIFSFLVFYLCISQMYNNLISQAGQMNLHGVPNDMIQAMAGVACVVCGPPIQAMYNLLARRRISFGPIARITAAFVFCGAAMAYAAGIQQLVYSTGPCYERPFSCAEIPNDVNVWVQLPVYFLLAIAEILGFVTAFEYAYSKAPVAMKSVVQAFTQLTAGLASALGMAISPAARDPNMVILYSCLGGVMGLCAALFWLAFRKYDKIDEELNRKGREEEEAYRKNGNNDLESNA